MRDSRKSKLSDQDALLDQLCNESLDAAGQARLSDSLADDLDAQQQYVRFMDLQAMTRLYAQSQDDEDFSLLETQAALDLSPVTIGDDSANSDVPNEATKVFYFSGFVTVARHQFAWTAAAALLLIALFAAIRSPWTTVASPPQASSEVKPAEVAPVAVARLRGTVGARWAGARLELPEGEGFQAGQHIELVEGLAEVCFAGGARVVLQGPAIAKIQNESAIGVLVGRIAPVVPYEAREFTVHTAAADLTGSGNEFGAEVDVDGSLVAQVYLGKVNLAFPRGDAETAALQLRRGQGAQVDATSGRTTLLPQPNELHFVRYLPHRETRINLAEIVAGGDEFGKAYHRGVSLKSGEAVDDYGAPIIGNGKFQRSPGLEFVDGVFIPDGKSGTTQVDSIGRTFAGFPVTSGDCWGGAIMARRPRYESSLEQIRLEFFGDIYGYVNWLHIASKSDELSPQGLGVIGMHANSGITFDLHAMRARHPDKQIGRFRALVGNLESRLEAGDASHTAEAWVLVDGKLRHHRRSFNRESGLEEIDISLNDRDRFLVLAVTDDGGNTAYDWVAFGDAVIEMSTREEITLEWPKKSRALDIVPARVGDEVHLARLH